MSDEEDFEIILVSSNDKVANLWVWTYHLGARKVNKPHSTEAEVCLHVERYPGAIFFLNPIR